MISLNVAITHIRTHAAADEDRTTEARMNTGGPDRSEQPDTKATEASQEPDGYGEEAKRTL
jgi:hypothetical protein